MSRLQRRRDKLHVIAEVIETAKEGALKTQIMYRVNLSFTQLNDYLTFMLKSDLLEKIDRNNREIYKATEQGLDFLERYQEITSLLRSESGKSTCPRCQKEVSLDHKFCPYCGKKLKIDQMQVKTR
jgi:predicted transcriptional regulator